MTRAISLLNLKFMFYEECIKSVVEKESLFGQSE